MRRKYLFGGKHSPVEKKTMIRKALAASGVLTATPAFGITLFCLTAIMSKGNLGFTAKIEKSGQDNTLLLLKDVDQRDSTHWKGTSFLSTTGNDTIIPTTASSIIKVRDSLEDVAGFEDGKRVYLNASGRVIGVSYSLFLRNTSTDESRPYVFCLGIDEYSLKGEGSTNPYSYLRVIVFENDLGSEEAFSSIYASPNGKGLGTKEGGESDLRECVSTYLVEDGLRRPMFEFNHTGYCDYFGQGEELVRKEEFISPDTTRHYEIMFYYEGEDPDCKGAAPEKSTITLSARFGV